jgi:hypothetical protein
MDLFLLLITSTALLIYGAAVATYDYRHGNMASPLCLTAALFCVHFAVPGVVIAIDQELLVIEQNLPYVLKAQVFALLCFAVFHGTYTFLFRRDKRTHRSGRTAQELWHDGRLLLVLAILFLAGWADRAYVIASDGYLQLNRAVQGQLEGPFYAAVRMIELFPQSAVFMALIHLFALPADDERRPTWVRICLFLWIAEFLYWLPSGRKEEIILLLITPFLLLNTVTGRLPKVRTVGLVAVMVIMLFPITFFYRAAWSEKSLAGADIFDVIRESAAEVQARNYDSQLSSGQIIFNRLSLLEPSAACVRLIDEREWELAVGESYTEALLGIIPRFMWPGKPDVHYGTTFGQDAGYIASNDDVTSISVSYVGEAYLNFGMMGFIAFVLMAAIYEAVYAKAKFGSRKVTWALMYATVLPILLYAGGTFALYFGGLIKLLPLFYGLSRFSSGVPRNPSASRLRATRATRLVS